MNKVFPSLRFATSAALAVGFGILTLGVSIAAQQPNANPPAPAPPTATRRQPDAPGNGARGNAASPAANGSVEDDRPMQPDAATPPPVGSTPNPLVLTTPDSAGGNPTVYYDREGKRRDPAEINSTEFGDYRGRRSRPGDPERIQALPRYGYSFFEPARRLIDARRNALRRNWQPNRPDRPDRPFEMEPGAYPEDGTLGGGDTGQADAEARYREQLSRMRGEVPATGSGNASSNGGRTRQDTGSARPSTGTGDAARTPADGSRMQTPDARTPQTGGYAPQAGGYYPSQPTMGTTPYPVPGGQTDFRANAASQSGYPTDAAPQGDYAAGAGGAVVSNRSPDAFEQVIDPDTMLTRNPITSVPPNYQLSAGDVLTIRYGTPTRTAREFSATVDAQGGLMIEGAGRIIVRGQSISQAERLVRQELTRLYKNPTVTITMRELRTMPITVSGAVYAPGTYVVPAVTTAFNVLYAAGGPTERGSMRRVEVRRRGALVYTLDLYRFLRDGTQAGDFALQPGDFILVPPRVSEVAVDGEVRNPAVFELIEGETLSDALRYADGVKPSAVDQRVQISSVNPGEARVLRDVNLRDRAQLASIRLYDGDVVEAFSVRSVISNSVTVEGAVDQPGEYALIPGMRVADLIERARGTIGEALLTRADLYRWNPDNTQTLIPIDLQKAQAGDPAGNVPLLRWDRLRVYTREEVAWTGNREVTVRGAVQRPGIYYRSENMRVGDLLLAAGGPMPEAYEERAVLLHQHPDGSFTYDYIRIPDAVRGDPAHNVALQDNDVLAVYRHGEARFTPERVVSIRGEVVAPGVYPRGEGMRVSDLLRLAGGFRPGAGPRVTVAHARRSADDPETALTTTAVEFDSQGQALREDIELRDGDVVTIQGTGGFRDKVQMVTIKGAVSRPGPIILSSNKMRLSDAIREAGGLRPEAYPEGVEFYRDPTLLATAGQKDLTLLISSLNDLLNQSAYQREQAKSDIERIKAAGSAAEEGSSPLGALAGGSTAARPNPAASTLGSSLARRELVSPPRRLDINELSPNGNIAVNLADALRRPESSDDILLVDGDVITVPEQPSTVQVVGAVYNARGVLYKPGQRLNYYIAAAGGFTMDAAQDRIVVIRAGGGILPSKEVRELKPGDVIVIPTRVLAEKIANRSNGLDSVIRSIGNSAIIYKIFTNVFGL